MFQQNNELNSRARVERRGTARRQAGAEGEAEAEAGTVTGTGTGTEKATGTGKRQRRLGGDRQIQRDRRG